MDDLISRSDLLKDIGEVMAQYNWKDDSFLMEMLSFFKDMVSDANVAYDVDKVVKELEGWRDYFTDQYCIYFNQRDRGMYEGFDSAIEIVRKGGVE